MLNKLKFAAGLAVVVTILGVMIGLSLKHRPAVESFDVTESGHRNRSDVTCLFINQF